MRRNNIKLSKTSILNILMLMTLSYFVFHSIYGNRGVLAYFRLQAELEKSHFTLAQLRAERLEVENRTKLLRPGSLDQDMLDEKVRSVLGLSQDNEKIFSTSKID